jgi:hypothetical protein
MMSYRGLGGMILALSVVMMTQVTATAAPPTGTVQSYDAYKSWLVACDNALSCVAKGFSEAYAGAQIGIDRDAGPAGKLEMSISADRAFALGDVKIDGKPAGLAGPAWTLDAAKEETTLSSDDLPAIRQLVARLRSATTMTLGSDAEVSLDGFAAAVLRLDDRQGRVGGVTALSRAGSLPASRIPVPPALPRIPYRPITTSLSPGEDKRLIAAVRTDQKAVLAKEDCDADTGALGPEAYALDGKQALVLIPCVMGAYQGSSLGFVAPRAGGHAMRLVLPVPYLGNDADQADSSYLTNSDFDPKTGTLSMFAKGRGLADCGLSASWVWDGAHFVLSDMSLQQACGGIEPGDWPILFRSLR